jgi:hypothetical protein
VRRPKRFNAGRVAGKRWFQARVRESLYFGCMSAAASRAMGAFRLMSIKHATRDMPMGALLPSGQKTVGRQFAKEVGMGIR